MRSDQWWSIAQAASYLNVSVRMTRRYAYNGRFAGVDCPDGRRMFRLAELEWGRHDHAPGGGGVGLVR